MNNSEVVLGAAFNRPFHKESFPGPIADGFNVRLPLSIYWLVGNFLGPPGDGHAAFCVYFLAIGLKILLVEAIKDYVGYWRPYFFSRCDFNTTTLQCDGLDNVKEGELWQSFPGGHAATAMCSMTVLTLYLVGKVVGSTRRRNKHIWAPSFLVKLAVLLAASPLVLGFVVAASRIRDEWHHPADVLAGMGLGTTTALLSHTLYYPSIWGEYAGVPRSTVESAGASPPRQESQPPQHNLLPV